MVVARAIGEIAFQRIVFRRQFDALNEHRGFLKVGHGHIKNRIVLLLDTGAFFKTAFEANSFELVGAESGTRRATVFDVRAVDVPTRGGLTAEHNIYLGGTDALVAHAK